MKELGLADSALQAQVSGTVLAVRHLFQSELDLNALPQLGVDGKISRNVERGFIIPVEAHETEFTALIVVQNLFDHTA